MRHEAWGILGEVVFISLGAYAAFLMNFPVLILSVLGVVIATALAFEKRPVLRNTIAITYCLISFGIMFIELFCKIQGGI